MVNRKEEAKRRERRKKEKLNLEKQYTYRSGASRGLRRMMRYHRIISQVSKFLRQG